MSKFRSNTIRMAGAGLLLSSAFVAGLWARPKGVAAGEDTMHKPVPVLVELFTSEGCSSCPPADALLAQLDAMQFVPGAHAIVLSEHVTYWNSLGWRDPFSFEKMTERQNEYASRLRIDSPYTPQAVVDGSVEFVGSDGRKLASAVARAAAAPKTALAIESAEVAGGSVKFAVRGEVASGMTLMAALADDAAQSLVLRGENGGRTLKHVAVVRTMEEMGAGVGDGRGLSLKLPGVLTQASAKSALPITSGLRLVVFVVERRTGRVVAVDERAVVR